MDEFTFQYELHRLKDQIEDMAEMRRVQQFAQYAPPRPFNPPRDVFLDQMRDLKDHLAGLERKFTSMCDAQRMAAHVQNPQYSQNMPIPAGPQETGISLPQNHLSLPSAPLFWKLFTSLRTDVQGLVGRVGGVEQTVSELEDKVDGMDALRFTPPGSTSSYDERGEYMRVASTYSEMLNSNSVNTPTNPLPHPSNDARVDTVRLPSISDLLASPEEQSWPASSHNNRLSPILTGYSAELAGATLTMLHRINDTMKGPNPVFSTNNAKLARAIVDLNSKFLETEVNHISQSSADLLGMSEPQGGLHGAAREVNLAEMDACNKEPVTGRTGLFHAEQEAYALLGSSLMASDVTKDGKAFRDQEISRLDELLRIAQEDLKASEQRALKHKEELQTVQDQHQRREESVREELLRASDSAGLIMQITSSLRAAEAEVDELREGRDDLGEAVMDLQRKLGAAKEHIGELQTALHDHSEREQDNERVMAQRLDELRGVQAFCDNKDTVIRRQEQVIARGARLLEERDDEIESLNRRLKAEVDDKEHEARQHSRLAKLLEERDSEVATMKAGIAHACAIPQRSPRTFNGELKSPDKQFALIKAHLDRCAQVAGVPGPKDYELVEHVAVDGSSEAIAVLKSDPTQCYKFWDEVGPHWSQSEEGWAPRPVRGERSVTNEARGASGRKHVGRGRARHEFGEPSQVKTSARRRSQGSRAPYDPNEQMEARQDIGEPRALEAPPRSSSRGSRAPYEPNEQMKARHGFGKPSPIGEQRSRGSPRQGQADVGKRPGKLRYLQHGERIKHPPQQQSPRSRGRDAVMDEMFVRHQSQARSSNQQDTKDNALLREQPQAQSTNQAAFMQAVANQGLVAAQTPVDYYPSGRALPPQLTSPQHQHEPASGRHGLPLDRTFWPPLPAPVGPAQQQQQTQRMQSMADMRSAARRSLAPGRAVRHHQSMQELPQHLLEQQQRRNHMLQQQRRRNLQAYVETEESGGEMGGEV